MQPGGALRLGLRGGEHAGHGAWAKRDTRAHTKHGRHAESQSGRSKRKEKRPAAIQEVKPHLQSRGILGGTTLSVGGAREGSGCPRARGLCIRTILRAQRSAHQKAEHEGARHLHHDREDLFVARVRNDVAEAHLLCPYAFFMSWEGSHPPASVIHPVWAGSSMALQAVSISRASEPRHRNSVDHNTF